MGHERPLQVVPAWIWTTLVLALAAHIAWQASRPPARAASDALPPPPALHALRLASFGEQELLSRLLMLYVQGFDPSSLDYRRLVAWLERSLALDPRTAYPLFAAARVFAEAPDGARARIALEFVHRRFLEDPNRRWRWLAHATLLAKHRLGDLALARRYAQALERHTSGADVPLWARQMEVFILEDMNELEAARIMLGGMLEKGEIEDPAELRFLHQRLTDLETRLPEPSK